MFYITYFNINYYNIMDYSQAVDIQLILHLKEGKVHRLRTAVTGCNKLKYCSYENMEVARLSIKLCFRNDQLTLQLHLLCISLAERDEQTCFLASKPRIN